MMIPTPRPGRRAGRAAAASIGLSWSRCCRHVRRSTGGYGRKFMMAKRRSKVTAFVAILALTAFGVLATASAQPSDMYPAAQIDAQDLERLVKARFGPDHAFYALALNKLGIAFQSQGKHVEAEGLFKRALAIREKVLGANHGDVGQSLNNLANAYRDQGKYADAETLFKRALTIREKALGANHSDVGKHSLTWPSSMEPKMCEHAPNQECGSFLRTSPRAGRS
jgi:tetratricopeptide (TPR) repeat protein